MCVYIYIYIYIYIYLYISRYTVLQVLLSQSLVNAIIVYTTLAVIGGIAAIFLPKDTKGIAMKV